MITLEISEAYQSQIETAPIETAAQTAMQHQDAPENAELTIVITGNDQIRELNQQYRDIADRTRYRSALRGHDVTPLRCVNLRRGCRRAAAKY